MRTDGTLAEARFDFDTGITVSNGGLNAPLSDMALYLQFLMGEPMRPEHDVVLKRRSLEEMWMPSLAARDGEGGSGDHVKIGLSFFVEQNGFISHLYLHRPGRAESA